jgi:hypothetical protein
VKPCIWISLKRVPHSVGGLFSNALPWKKVEFRQMRLQLLGKT